MKKLLIVSAAAAALLFTACSTSSDVETPMATQATQAVQTAATISSLISPDSEVASALKKANGVITAADGGSAITIPATALVNGDLSDSAKSTLDVVANALVATNTTAKVAKVGAANSFTKKTADYLTSKGVTVENVAKIATSDNKIATGVAILLAQ